MSGNWCWILKDRQDLRWSLTHGWRVAIFITTVSIYTYVYIYLARSYRQVSNIVSTSSNTGHGVHSEQELRCMNTKPDSGSYGKGNSGTTTVMSHENQPARSHADKTPELRWATSNAALPGLCANLFQENAFAEWVPVVVHYSLAPRYGQSHP